jgi:hypothetical protein
MKKFTWVVIMMCLQFVHAKAQEIYTIGYEKAEIEVVDSRFFSQFQFPGQEAQCGIYDKESQTFYTCFNKTYRYVSEENISELSNEMCCEKINFDPNQYYGTLTLAGVIDDVEWDNMIIHFTTDKARLTIHVDEREIDALYDKFYKQNHLGKIHILLRLNTYDTPNENVLSYNLNTYMKPKPKRIFTKILRW